MKRLLSASCVAMMCAAGLSAQTPTGTQTKPQTPSTTGSQTAQKPSQGDDKSAVVRGCLRAGDAQGTFVLSNASATSGGTLKNATVQLVGSPAGTSLKDHIGHTVEVTGMLAAGDSRMSGSGASAGTGGTTGTGTTGGTSTGAGTGTGAGKGAGTGTTAGAGTGTGAGATAGKGAGAGTGAGAGATAGTSAGAAAGTSKLTVKAVKHVKEGC